MIANTKTSHIVESQVPFFVRSDHPNFVAFLEHYYKYLEQDTKAVRVLKNIKSYQDIDKTVDIFADKLYDTFTKLLPVDILADRKLVLKNIKDFTRSKGVEKSARFLMRVMFNEDIDFYYPKEDVLRASDGKWFIQKTLRIENLFLDDVQDSSFAALEKYVNTRILGQTSLAQAVVERVDRFFERGTQIDELVLSGIYRNFVSGETITANFTNSDGQTSALRSKIFGGIVNSIRLDVPGAGYSAGDLVPLISSTGSGAKAQIARVSSGNLSSIVVIQGGAGYRALDPVIITGGSPAIQANAKISSVDISGIVHPNSYSISYDTIGIEGNTTLGNIVFSNLNSSDANTTYENALSFYSFSNTGPAATVLITNAGDGYQDPPTISALANNTIRSLGILGRLEIVSGGEGYEIGDTISFSNVPGGYGSGAAAVVSNVDTSNSNSIRSVSFSEVPGFPTGGSGYDPFYLPIASVSSSNGSNAIITVKNILGTGATFLSANSVLGAIQRIIITAGGSGYETPPIVDLTGLGDGTAVATTTVVRGLFEYPGRFLNDDGQVSAYNFIQDRDYYQNFSYVVRSKVPIKDYRKSFKDLIHPSGTKMFGEYILGDDIPNNSQARIIESNTYVSLVGTFELSNVGNSTNNPIIMTTTNHNLNNGDIIYINFNGELEVPYPGSNGEYSVSNVINDTSIQIYAGRWNVNTSVYYSGIYSGNVTVFKEAL